MSSSSPWLDAVTEELQGLRKNWGWFLVLGVGLIILGCVAISSSFIATLATVVVIGTFLVIGGVLEVVSGLRAGNWRGLVVHLLTGILYIVAGILMIEKPEIAAAALTLMLAAAFLFGGLLRIVISVSQRFSGWGWVLLHGVISVVLGIMIWRQWPEASYWVIGLFVGIDLLFAGWSWVMLALGIRSLPAPAPER